MIGKVVTLILILSWTGPSFAQSNPEKDILASAIKILASTSPDEDIKTRLRKQESALKKIDEIMEFYAGTDTGLELLINDKLGKYDVQELRQTYLKELIDFNLTTCESTPSFTCLGFLSLDNGTKACENPKQFSQFLTASNNFQNAYRIFKSQGDAKKNELGVLSSYRQCANRTPNDFSRDFINSRLVNILLDNGDESKAVGITQNMTTRLFKIIATADIRVAQGKYDYPTFKTILASAESLNNMIDKESALLILTNKLFEVGLNPFSQEARNLGIKLSLNKSEFLYPKKQFPMTSRGERFGSTTCTAQEKYFSELAMDYLFHVWKMTGGLPGFGGVSADYSSPDSFSLNQEMSPAYKRANWCSDYNVDSIIYFIATDPEVAGNLRGYQLEKGVGEKDGVDFFLKTLTTDQILDYYNYKNGILEKKLLSLKGTSADRQPTKTEQKMFGDGPYALISLAAGGSVSGFMYPFYGQYGQFSIFKIFVDLGDVCNASSQLFQEIRGGDYESDAVSYFISSPNISVDKKYECGDADLDLLLN